MIFVSQKMNTVTLITILKKSVIDWNRYSDELRNLDAVIGDGDMGVTVSIGSRAIVECLADPNEEDIGKLLMKCGMQLNKASPSTFGTLLASAFMEAGKAILGRKEIEIKDLLLVGKGAIEGIKKRGKAEIGDKTMLDSLVPAIETFQRTLDNNGADYRAAIEAGVKASKAGAEATIEMKAKYSRASYRQDGGVGVQDAGATAMYRLIEAFGKNLLAQI